MNDATDSSDATSPPPDRLARAKTRRFVGPVVDVGHRLSIEWRKDRVTGLAAEVAFWAVLSLFPALLALGAAIGFLEPIFGSDFSEQARQDVVTWTEDVLGGDGGGIGVEVNELFDRRSAGIFTVGIALALWTASRGFSSLIRALDVVYDLDERRRWFGVRLTALGLACGSLLVVALVLVMIIVGPLFGRGQEIADDIGAGSVFVTLWTWARVPFVVAVLVAWATTVFHVAPNHHTPWRWDLPGALLTTVLWGVGIVGFRIYLELTSEGNSVLGILGGALTLMLWMYVTSLAVLVGGELNADLASRRGGARALQDAPVRRLATRARSRLRRPGD